MTNQPNLKYAHVERERRFLLYGLPQGWENVPVRTITDRYIAGTRLRMRTVVENGERTVWKLGQKIRFDPSSPERVAHTTVYLDESEATVIAGLPAKDLQKMRRTRPIDGHLWAVDEFLSPLTGLFLAEVDLETAESTCDIPFPIAAEVTRNDRFSGESLANLSPDDLGDLIGSVRE